jgi:hypothetical protein
LIEQDNGKRYRYEINILIALLKAADDISQCSMITASSNLLLARGLLSEWEQELQRSV